MEPFYSAIDPEALDQLFESLRRSFHQKGDEPVEFTFDGHRVTVLSNGDIEIRQHTTTGARDEPIDEIAFYLELTRLLREATANGVDIEGRGWEYRNESDSTWGSKFTVSNIDNNYVLTLSERLREAVIQMLHRRVPLLIGYARTRALATSLPEEYHHRTR